MDRVGSSAGRTSLLRHRVPKEKGTSPVKEEVPWRNSVKSETDSDHWVGMLAMAPPVASPTPIR